MINLQDLFFAFQLGVLGYVFSCVLMQEKYLLEKWLDLLLDLEIKKIKNLNVGQWLAYPLGLCEKCFTGQVAFWIWVKTKGQNYLCNDLIISLLEHSIFIAFAILSVSLIKKISEK